MKKTLLMRTYPVPLFSRASSYLSTQKIFLCDEIKVFGTTVASTSGRESTTDGSGAIISSEEKDGDANSVLQLEGVNMEAVIPWVIHDDSQMRTVKRNKNRIDGFRKHISKNLHDNIPTLKGNSTLTLLYYFYVVATSYL